MDETRARNKAVGMTGPDAEPNQDSVEMEPPQASSMLARTVYAIAQEHSEARILSLVAEGAAIELGKKATLVLLTWDSSTG